MTRLLPCVRWRLWSARPRVPALQRVLFVLFFCCVGFMAAMMGASRGWSAEVQRFSHSPLFPLCFLSLSVFSPFAPLALAVGCFPAVSGPTAILCLVPRLSFPPILSLCPSPPRRLHDVQDGSRMSFYSELRPRQHGCGFFRVLDSLVSR